MLRKLIKYEPSFAINATVPTNGGLALYHAFRSTGAIS